MKALKPGMKTLQDQSVPSRGPSSSRAQEAESFGNTAGKAWVVADLPVDAPPTALIYNKVLELLE
ncbi:MAG: hypothetical protein ACLPX5_14495 [Dissulfurispiraceae bacterium]